MLLAHERFEQRVGAAPDAIAVRFRDAELSYAALNARANQLARYLTERGVGRESRVVVCLEPGLDIAVALLGILKAGGVYVPLDPSYPPARIRVILEDTDPAYVLTRTELAAALPSFGTTLQLDLLAAELSESPGENLLGRVEPDQTAYVYYTSGTTGVPKGVLASHANLASYLNLAQQRYGFTGSDVGPALARFGFSISMFELMNPLVAGGTLVVLERQHVLDLPRLSETLRSVTFFHAGPSLLRSLLRYIKGHYADLSVFDGVRHASSGGDTVPVAVLEGLREVFGKAEVFVIYGSSEISCMGTTYPVPRDTPLLKTYVGKPFDGVGVELVDDELRSVPTGVVGEVLFTGPGVVKGYLNRSELTQERFIERDGVRYYRTGDRGRFDEAGLLELVGRTDFQVKLGGIRVELGEIEHHLRQAPGVENGVVVAKEREDGEKFLVAYVVIAGDGVAGEHERAAAIRRHLREQLPEHMLPSAIVELAALPLNHNMKIDRKALPDAPRIALRATNGRAARSPETETERRLAELWQRALGLDFVGLDDNFFDLGGQSRLALQVIVDADRELGATLSGLELLREPLQILADLCDARSGRKSAARRTEPLPAPAADAIELFHFGHEQTLFGVLHGPTTVPASTAVLICAPLGHEYLRSHFVLQRLARGLAANGVPTLRFDYFGCGDSLGDSTEATCARWRSDIVDAHRELKRRTQAARVVAVGARLGATLLASVGTLDWAGIVLWDPVVRGDEHVTSLRQAHRRLQQSGPFSLRWPSLRLRDCELLGAGYSKSALRELSELRLPPADACAWPSRTLSTESPWYDVARLEDMLPDVGISPALMRFVQEVS